MADPRQIKYVWGPCVAWLLIHPEDKQTVLIFGERHGKYEKKKCGDLPDAQEISAYIRDLALNNSERIDLFVEEEYHIYVTGELERHERASEASANILETFKDCLELKRRYECPLNVRFQHVDIRSTPLVWSIRLLSSRINAFHNALKKDPSLLLPEFLRKEIAEFLRRRFEEGEETFQQWQKLIQKELAGYDPYFGNRIKENLEKKIRASEYEESFLLSIRRNLRELIKDEKEKSFDEGANGVSTSEARVERARVSNEVRMLNTLQVMESITSFFLNTLYILDLFTLARMFHRYTRSPHQAKRVIFYGGAKHSANIRNFLLSCNYIDITDYSTRYPEECGQCTQLPSFHLIKYYMSDHPQTIIVGDSRAKRLSEAKEISPYPKGITVTMKELLSQREDIASSQTALWLENPLYLNRVRSMFPDNEIFLLHPDAVYIGESLDKLPADNIRFIQILSSKEGEREGEIDWRVRLGFIDEEVPVYVEDESLLLEIERLFPVAK
jgi:tetratricopeptide (TPR) repeat protein